MQHIYKYMSFLQFLDLVEARRLYLSSIENWEDKYEAFAARKHFMPTDIKNTLPPELLLGFQEVNFKTLYAQSWTSVDESDALWRIYSNGSGVRIRTTVQEVLQAISRSLPSSLGQGYEVKNLDHFAVTYKDELAYTDVDFSSGDKYEVTPEKALRDKRKAFEHEKEYRFCVRVQKQLQGGPTSDPAVMYEILKASIPEMQYIYYDFDITNISEIKLDPRAPKYVEETFLSYCKNRNFSGVGLSFLKSKLYTI